MKNIYTYILVLITSLLAISCEEEIGIKNEATPVIQYIRSTDVSEHDLLLARASMGSTIAIMGNNLSGIVEVMFNDQKARLNPVFITNTSIIVTIPGVMPTEITNQITLNTKKGKTCVYDFAVIIPNPKVESISCEWAKDGSDVTIYGDYFFADTNGQVDILFPGNLSVKSTEVTTTQVKCKVPVGALPGSITVESIYGKSRSQFTFRSSEGLFLDFEDPTDVWNTWERGGFGTENAIDGQYFTMEGTVGSWAWPASSLQFFYKSPTGTLLIPEDAKPNDYILKFECYSHEWHDTVLLLWFSNVNDISADGEEALYHWKPFAKDGVKTNYVTNGWVTISIPISDFVYAKDESDTSRSMKISDMVNFTGMFFGTADSSTTAKVWFDNMRLEKIK